MIYAYDFTEFGAWAEMVCARLRRDANVHVHTALLSMRSLLTRLAAKASAPNNVYEFVCRMITTGVCKKKSSIRLAGCVRCLTPSPHRLNVEGCTAAPSPARMESFFAARRTPLAHTQSTLNSGGRGCIVMGGALGLEPFFANTGQRNRRVG